MSSNSSCSTGVYDCNYAGIPAEEVSTCANYNRNFDDVEGREWVVIISGIFMCLMGLGIGANDASNSWATSVGSGAIKIKRALLIGGTFQFLGTVLLGSSVAKTIKEDIADINDPNCWACGYCNSKISLFQTGMLSSLVSTCLFLMISSFTKLPVSTTHAMVGSVVGKSVGAVGPHCVNWGFSGMGFIFASWVLSPLLAGLITVLVYKVTKELIISSEHAREMSLRSVPVFITFVTTTTTFLIFMESDDLKELSIVVRSIATTCIGIVTFLLSFIVVLPWIKRQMPSSSNAIGSTGSIELVSPSASRSDMLSESQNTENNSELEDSLFCFKTLLIFNAALKSFAHGASLHATGPFVAVLEVYNYGLDTCANGNESLPRWVLVLSGISVALGIYNLGHRVIETVGENVTVMNYHSAFCIELGSCVSIMLAVLLGIPVSSTHCQIGAMVGAGFFASEKNNVSWGVIKKIIVGWILTIPFSALLSVAFMELLRPSVS